MSVLIASDQQRALLYGTQVTKAAAVLPATATSTLWTISGGNILITGLVGECTTVCSATVTTLAIGLAPTVGTAATGGLASATAITSAEVGVHVGLGATAGAALVVAANAGGAILYGNATKGIVAKTGTITITTSATNTGAFKWYMTYVVLDNGASVA